MTEPWYRGAEDGPALDRALLLPGALVPDAELDSQFETLLATALD